MARRAYAAAREAALQLYSFAARATREQRGIVLADTKFELGVDGAGVVTLGDEALTPDSSRFWPADEYRPAARNRRSTSSTCATLSRDRMGSAPTRGLSSPSTPLPGTRARYVEAFERLTGYRVRPLSRRPEGGAK